MSDTAAMILGGSIVVASLIRAMFPQPLVRLSEWSSIVKVEGRVEAPRCTNPNNAEGE